MSEYNAAISPTGAFSKMDFSTLSPARIVRTILAGGLVRLDCRAGAASGGKLIDRVIAPAGYEDGYVPGMVERAERLGWAIPNPLWCSA